ncbi:MULTISPECIES: acyltransferase family protein [Pseudomonas fluorescens group]|uniref:Acyltransferase family protein n=1 Tax=Pseudomonas fluorescens TaxID=294 RepID=A0A0D0SE49_PSEFL|nr:MULTISPECIES: acyltransferase [Pseudomonas fluorescens group]AZE60877.1 Exopolysaccharide production protein ExoZ [Pseudomonas synxantha]KIR20538.1 Acyltransferase family protein [Pseudomonas fluorescens]
MLISVQALRALAAWMVVGVHFMQLFFDFEAHNALEYLLADKGGIGVDIFFVISGFVIFLATADKALTPWRFMLMRVARIVPAYWFYTLLMIVLVATVPSVFPQEHLEPSYVLMSLLFIAAPSEPGVEVYPLLGVGWTLNFEMLFYALFSVALLARESYRLWVAATLLFLVCYIGPALGLVSGFYSNDIVLEFLMGIMLGMLYRRGWCQARPWLPVLGIVVALTAIYHGADIPRALEWGVPSAIIVISCVALEPWFQGSRFLKLLGDCSYSVYLIHVPVLAVGYFVAQWMEVDPYAMLLVCIVVIAVGAYASYYWLEKSTYRGLKRLLGVEDRAIISRQKY